MRTETIEVYTFEELSEEAQKRAMDQWARNRDSEPDWADEWRDTLKAAEKALPFNVRNYNVDPCGITYVHIVETLDREIELSGVRLWKWLQVNGPDVSKDCPWTGYCGDEDFLKPYRAFLKRPDLEKSFLELLQECVDNWASAWAQDIEYQYSEEYIRDNIIANELEYLKDGTRYL